MASATLKTDGARGDADGERHDDQRGDAGPAGEHPHSEPQVVDHG